jgi:hypothetical protein
MFDRFRIPRPAVVAARLLGLLGVVALTCASSAFGVMALIDHAFGSYRCPSSPTRSAKLRILDLHAGLSHHHIDKNRCPTPGDLIREKYTHPHNLVDPWGTSIAYWCLPGDFEIRSAGPDKFFDTDDDVTNWL